MKRMVSYNSEEYVLYSIIENDEPLLIHRDEMERMNKLYIDYERFTTAPDEETVEFKQMIQKEDGSWHQGEYGGTIPVNRIRAEWVAFQ